MHRYASLVVAATALLGLACRASTTDAGPQPANVVVTPGTVTIPQMGTASLTVSVTDQDQRLLTNAPVTFESSNATILKVSSAGLISSVGPAGTANVIVHAGHATATVPVTMTQVPSEITVTPSPLILNQKSSAQLTAHLLDAVGTIIPGAVITYTPSNPAMLGVSTGGLVLSLGPGGTSDLTLAYGTRTRLLDVFVQPLQGGLKLSADTILIVQHGAAQLVATILDLLGIPAGSGPMILLSSNLNIVAVDNTGLLRSVGGLGSASITVLSGSFSQTATAVVVPPGHPAGVVAATADIYEPRVVAMSSTGIVLVTRPDGAGVIRATLPETTFQDAFASAGLGITFNSSATSAYAANTANNEVDILDIALHATYTLIPGIIAPTAVIVSPDGSTLYVGTAGDSLVSFNVYTKTLHASLPVPGVNSLCNHPIQPLVYASSSGSGAVVEINSSANTTARTFNVGPAIEQCVVSHDGSTLYVLQDGGDLLAFDLATGAQLPSIPGGGGFGIALTPDGTQLWVTSGGSVKVIDIATRSIIRTISVPATARQIAFSPDGYTAVVASDGGGVTFIK